MKGPRNINQPGLARAWRIIQNRIIEAENRGQARAAFELDQICKEIEAEMEAAPMAMALELGARRRQLAARMEQQ